MNPTSVVSTATGSVNSSIISVSKEEKHSENETLASSQLDSISILFFFNERSGWDDSGEKKNAGPDLDRPSAPLPPMTRWPPGPLPRPAPRPPLPRTLRSGGMESGRSSRSAGPGPRCPSEPCLRAPGQTRDESAVLQRSPAEKVDAPTSRRFF